MVGLSSSQAILQLMYSRESRIEFVDIVALRIIVDYYKRVAVAPFQTDLISFSDDNRGLINEWLEDNSVSPDYAKPLTSARSFTQLIRVLRLAKLLVSQRHYIPTKKADEFLDQLGRDWRTYPVYIPVEQDGTIRFDLAQYDR
jgi:hypothetical protein